jgi:hypothetical protein
MINSETMYDFEIFRSGNALPVFFLRISDAYWFRDNSPTFKIVSPDACFCACG